MHEGIVYRYLVTGSLLINCGATEVSMAAVLNFNAVPLAPAAFFAVQVTVLDVPRVGDALTVHKLSPKDLSELQHLKNIEEVELP